MLIKAYYLYCYFFRGLLRKLSKTQREPLRVIDVGCGSGWKLVNYLSKEFTTIGIETEPALSFLRRTYPDLVKTY